MECATGVRTAPTGAGWIWATLADSPSSYHIPSLAPAVALPAPRHDRRRTGAAGSPPGGFPFVPRVEASFWSRARCRGAGIARAGQHLTPLIRDGTARHGGRIAQLVEQLTLNQRVPGSGPC